MTDKIYISAVTGLTLTVQLYNGAVSVGSPIAAAEIGTTGEYVATIPGATPAGYYLAIAIAGSDKIASGDFIWNGFSIVDLSQLDEVHKIQGLDENNPMIATPVSRSAGDIELEVSGYGSSTTTVTRQ